MRFTDLSFNLPIEQQASRGFYKRGVLKLGENIIFLRIIPRVGIDFDRVNLRFVNKDKEGWKFWRWKDAPKSKVSITNMEPYDPRAQRRLIRSSGFRTSRDPVEQVYGTLLNNNYFIGEHWFSKTENGVGGFFVDFDPPYRRSEDEPLWIVAEVIAHGKWKGHISFKGRRGLEARAHVRLPVEIIDPPASDMEDSQGQ